MDKKERTLTQQIETSWIQNVWKSNNWEAINTLLGKYRRLKGAESVLYLTYVGEQQYRMDEGQSSLASLQHAEALIDDKEDGESGKKGELATFTRFADLHLLLAVATFAHGEDSDAMKYFGRIPRLEGIHDSVLMNPRKVRLLIEALNCKGKFLCRRVTSNSKEEDRELLIEAESAMTDVYKLFDTRIKSGNLIDMKSQFLAVESSGARGFTQERLGKIPDSIHSYRLALTTQIYDDLSESLARLRISIFFALTDLLAIKSSRCDYVKQEINPDSQFLALNKMRMLFIPSDELSESILIFRILYHHFADRLTMPAADIYTPEENKEFLAVISVITKQLQFLHSLRGEFLPLAETLEQALFYDSDNEETLFRLGLSVSLSEFFSFSLPIFDKIHKGGKENAYFAMICYAQVCIDKHFMLDEAITRLSALESVKDPLRFRLLHSLGLLHMLRANNQFDLKSRQSRLDIAEKLFEEALELEKSDVRLTYHAALVYTLNWKERQAVPLLKKLLKEASHFIPAYTLLAAIYTAPGYRRESAIALLETALLLDPTNASVFNILAQIHLRSGNMTRALQTCKRAFLEATFPGEDFSKFKSEALDDITSDVSSVNQFKGNFPDDIAPGDRPVTSAAGGSSEAGVVGSFLGTDPEGLTEVWLTAATAFLEHDQPDDARDCCEEAGRVLRRLDKVASRLNAKILHLKGRICMNEAKYDEARRFFELGIHLAPTSANCNFSLFETLLKEGRVSSALIRIRRAIQNDPIRFELWNAYGKILEEEGNYDEAAAALHTAAFLSSKVPLVPYVRVMDANI